MNCWNLARHEFANDYHAKAPHAKYVEAVLISPVGKTFVTGTAPFWNDRTASGGLRRWDMTAPGWPELKTPAWVPTPGGVLAAVFVLNGRADLRLLLRGPLFWFCSFTGLALLSAASFGVCRHYAPCREGFRQESGVCRRLPLGGAEVPLRAPPLRRGGVSP